MNTYLYSLANPIIYFDPTGLVVEEMCKKGVDQFCKSMNRRCRQQCGMTTFSTMCSHCDSMMDDWKKEWHESCEAPKNKENSDDPFEGWTDEQKENFEKWQNSEPHQSW